MSIDPRRTTVIVNPRAAAGRVGREWPALEATLRRGIGRCRIEHTARAGHGIELAERAVRGGATTVLSLGGDGTHNEVLNGVLRADAADDVVLGILPAGTGGDFGRMLATKTLDEALRVVPEGRAAPIDVGRVDFVGDDGGARSRWFLNLASCGLSGLIDHLVNGSSKRLGGRASFLLGTLRAMAQYDPPRVRVRVDGEAVGEWGIYAVTVCNGRYAGGGMCFAPGAALDDGVFDVVVFESVPARTAVANLPKLYTGGRAELSWVHRLRGREVRVEALDGGARVDIDGEAPGAIPATFTLLPARVRLLGV